MDFSVELSDKPFHEKDMFICISKKDKPLLKVHNTSCSTSSAAYICVHLQADNAALKILLDIFKHTIESNDAIIYDKIYKDALDTSSDRQKTCAA